MVNSTVARRYGGKLAAGGVVCLAAAAAVAGWVWWRAQGPRLVRGPIILISVDTLRADHLRVYGYRGVETPAIDTLAADGIVFDHAWTHSPLTLPAHTSILSGQLPFEHGVRDNIGFSVNPRVVLLPSLLKQVGYASGGVVSAYVLRRETGIAHGFDFFDSQLPAASPEMSFGQVQRDGALSVQIAADWIGRQVSPRYFLFLHLYEPHKPYTPPARYARYAPYRRGDRLCRRAGGAAARPAEVPRRVPIKRSSCSSRTTARASGTTARTSTACSSTARPRTCRSS